MYHLYIKYTHLIHTLQIIYLNSTEKNCLAEDKGIEPSCRTWYGFQDRLYTLCIIFQAESTGIEPSSPKEKQFSKLLQQTNICLLSELWDQCKSNITHISIK